MPLGPLLVLKSIAIFVIVAILCAYFFYLQRQKQHSHSSQKQENDDKQLSDVLTANKQKITRFRGDDTKSPDNKQVKHFITSLLLQPAFVAKTPPLSRNVRFFRVKPSDLSSQLIVTSSSGYKAFDVNIVAVSETLSQIWQELRSTLMHQRAETIADKTLLRTSYIGGDNTQNNAGEKRKVINFIQSGVRHAKEFDVWLDKQPRSWSTNATVGNLLKGNHVEIQLQNDLYYDAIGMETMIDLDGYKYTYSKARNIRALQWDRKIAMLAHMWMLYARVEQSDDDTNDNNNDNVEDDKSVSVNTNYVHTDITKKLPEFSGNSVLLRQDLARHVAVCMNAFIDATGNEGLAHLGGLLILYMRTMDESAVNDSRYVEL